VVEKSTYEELAKRIKALEKEIVERKRIEEALRLTEFSIDTAPLSIFWITREGNFVYVNEAMCQKLGYSCEELLGMSIEAVDPDYPAERWPKHWEEVRHKKALTFESRHRTKDGRIFPVEITVHYSQFGGQEYIFAFATDIAEHKRIDERIRVAHAELEQIFNTGLEGMRVIDKDFNVLRMNETFLALCGLSKGKMEGKKCYDVLRGPLCHTPNCPLTWILACEEGLECEVEKERTDGGIIPCILSATPFRGSDGEVVGIVEAFRDISRIKRAERIMKESEKLALAGKLAAGVAHSIRNPLTSVKMRLYSLQRSLNLSETQNEDLGVVSKEISNIDGIVQSFLEFARPPKARMQRVSPSDVVDVALRLVRTRLESHGADVKLNRKHCLSEILADPEQLEEAIVNLLVNASEAMGFGGQIVICEQEERLQPFGRAAVIQVSDNGPGIPEAMQDKLFEPFFSTKDEGSGLGLSIAARIVEEHGGWLNLTSEKGRGTTFTITLPYKEEQS